MSAEADRAPEHSDAGTPEVTFARYDRLTSRTDGAGTWNYSWHPTSTAPSHPSTTNGGGQLVSVDGPWTDDTISYTYDDVGRRTTRSMPHATYANLS